MAGILSCLDRLASNELVMTQKMIARMLGVRREGVTEAAGRLQEAGLISYHRGRIAALDRRQLEAQTCECYAVVKQAYDELLRPMSASADIGVRGTRRQYRTQRQEPAHAELI